jgi:hypothetical protein
MRTHPAIATSVVGAAEGKSTARRAMRYPRPMGRWHCALAVMLAAGAACAGCAAERARGPLTIPLGLTPADTTRALRAFDFCHQPDGPRPVEELFPACDHPGLGRGDSWVIARYDGGVLVGLRRFERWADPRAARERWDQLVARRAEKTPPSNGARQQLQARRAIPAEAQAWVAFSSGDELIGVFLLSPAEPDDPAILEEIVPALE